MEPKESPAWASRGSQPSTPCSTAPTIRRGAAYCSTFSLSIRQNQTSLHLPYKEVQTLATMSKEASPLVSTVRSKKRLCLTDLSQANTILTTLPSVGTKRSRHGRYAIPIAGTCSSTQSLSTKLVSLLQPPMSLELQVTKPSP